MFENFLIRPDSLRNEEKNGEVVGFTLAVRNANYRGVFLSLHNGYYLSVDGVEHPTNLQTFEINGQHPRSFDEIRKAVWEHWDYDDEGILHVRKPGGLAPGTHTIRFQQSVLAAYGYLPTDEEWAKNPPKPGTGAGSDKSPQITSYTLTLNEKKIKRGVSLYSYQQSQFLKQLDLEAQIREVGLNLYGADGIEIVDEMSLHYPDPGQDFIRQWFIWMEKYNTVPVTMDVGMDVLQFRDHVMSIEECAERLRNDIRLAKTMGFRNVRVLSVVPMEILVAALPLAESLDIPLGKEVHQPMTLEGNQVTEIIEYVSKTGTKHLGIVPDFGIFQFRPSEALLSWFQRRGATENACAASVDLANLLRHDEAPFGCLDLALHTAGNLRSAFTRFLNTGKCERDFAEAFNGVKRFADERVPNAKDIDYTIVAESLMLSRTSPETLRKLSPYVTGVHGKFINMSPVPGKPCQFQDISIDYESGIGALKEGGFEGYINSEYEGQRFFQDRGRADLMDEVEQVRRHQEMLKRLTA